MKTFWKLLGVLLVSLALWGCGGQSQSETSTQNEAIVQGAVAETQKEETTNLNSQPRSFITKWKGEAGKELRSLLSGPTL